MRAAGAKLTWASVLTLIITFQISGCPRVPEYVLEVVVDGGGGVFLPPDESGYPAPFAGGVFPEGSEFELTATPDDGYRFVRWEGDAPAGNEGDSPLTIWVNTDMSITAVFIRQFTLAVDADGEGSIEVDGADVAGPFDEVFDDGSEVVLTATPADGWRFSGWEGDVPPQNEEANPLAVSMGSDMSITAVFIQEFTLTVDANGQGSIEVDGEELAGPFDEVFDDGSEVVLTAAPAEGWWFLGWEGDYSGTDSSITVTMDADTDVTAMFVAVAGRRNVTIVGITGPMTLALQGSTVKGGWGFIDLGLDVDGTISGDEVVLTCTAPGIDPSTITATVQPDGSWSGTIDGSGFETDLFSAAPVDFTGSGDGRAAVRTTLLPLYGLTGRLTVASDGSILRGTWRFALYYGVDVEGTLTESEVTFTGSAPGWEPFTADATVQADGSWVGVLNGSGFVDEPFEADPPFFP